MNGMHCASKQNKKVHAENENCVEFTKVQKS